MQFFNFKGNNVPSSYQYFYLIKDQNTVLLHCVSLGWFEVHVSMCVNMLFCPGATEGL